MFRRFFRHVTRPVDLTPTAVTDLVDRMQALAQTFDTTLVEEWHRMQARVVFTPDTWLSIDRAVAQRSRRMSSDPRGARP